MIILQANDISRRFADDTLFENVSFNIQTNDRIALVGRNGTGKSTLIKQIMKEEPVSDGSIHYAKNISIGYLEQNVSIDSTLTIWQEMLSAFQETLSLRQAAEQAAIELSEVAHLENSPEYRSALARYDQLQEQLTEKNAYAIESTIRTVLHGFRFFEADFNTPVSTLSGGQKTRLALAKMLLMEYDLLILDEPTNHLDMQTLSWLENYLTHYQGALLIVSHDRYFLDRIATQVIELRHQTAHLYKGNYSFYIKEKALRQAQALQAYEKQQEEIAKLETFVQKNIARASTTKLAQSRRKQLEKMTRIERPQQDEKAPRIQFSSHHESGERVIQAVDLTVGYDTPIAENINFDLRKQDAIAIVGPNGIGKSTLLKTLTKEIPAISGEVTYGTGVEIGYYSQTIDQLDEHQTVLETLWQAHDTTDEWKIRSILGSFLFSGDSVDKKVSMLSGGEKARLSLALLATEHDNTLFLDEPTNHLDIDSKEILEQALIEYDGTLLFVSHDRYFINRIATQVLEITPTGTTLYLGDYDYYLAKKEEQAQLTALTQTSESPSNLKQTPSDSQLTFEESKIKKRTLRRLTQEVEKAMEHLDTLESSITEIHQLLETASITNNQSDLMSLHQQLQSLEAEQADWMEKWETASLALEEFETNES